MSNSLNLLVRFNALDNLSGALKNIVGLGKSGDQVLKGMNRQAGQLRGEMKKLDRELATAGLNATEDQIARQRELRNAIASVNQQIERQKRLNAIDGKVARIQQQGRNFQQAGQQNMLAGAGIVTPFVLAGKAAMDFSSGMVDIQQKAGLTNAETAQMARNIMLAARAAHQLPEDMRAGVDTLSGLGLDPRQAVQMIGPIGRLGTAFKVDLADGANAAYANLNNLKVPLNEATRAFDVMTATGNAGAFEVKDMARHFPGLTAQAQALGQSGLGAVADLSAALQIARRATGTSDEAGTNVRNLLNKINSPAAIRAFSKNFGVDLPAALKRAYAEGKTPMEALAEITKKATGGDLGKLGFVIEDTEAQSALRALIQNLDDYRKIRAEALQSSGTVDKAFRQRELQDASVKWQGLKGRLQESAIVLGTKLLPAASQFVNVLVPMIDGITRFADAHPQLTGNMLVAVAGFGAARIGLGALQFAFGSVLGPMAAAWGWWAKYKEFGSIAAAFPKVAKAFGVLRTAALFLGQGLMRAGAMMLANPMVLIITAIVVAIGVAAYLIYTHWDKIKAAFNTGVAMLGKAWSWVKAKFQAFPGLFGPIGLVASFVINHWGQIKAGFNSGIAMLGSAWTWIKGKLALFPLLFSPLGLVATVIMTHWGAIKGAFNSGVAMIGQAWAWVRGKFDSGVTMVKTAIGGLPSWLASLGGQMMAGLINALSPSALAERLLAIARGGVTAFKNYFGIKSPSRLFMTMGGHMTSGLAIGVDRGGKQPLGAMRRMAAGVAAAGAVALAPHAMALPSSGPDPRVDSIAMRPNPLAATKPAAARPLELDQLQGAAPALRPGPALAPRTQPPGARPIAAPLHVEIKIYQQPGEDAEKLADRVIKAIERKKRGAGLGDYGDDF